VAPPVAAIPAPAPAVVAAVEKPAFWFGFEVSWAKLALGRALLFGMLALDALLQIRHAPRYGAGGFNVAQVFGLDALAPNRITYGIAQLVESYLFVVAAFGIATRVVVPVAAGLYGWLYFASELDGYQHHYLVAMILVVACFVPWTAPPEARADTPVRSWALRLLLVEIAIMYLWAAISKLEPAWLDGRAIAMQLGTGRFDEVIVDSVGWGGAAKLILVTEFVLAATVWLRPAWIVAAPLGIALHTGIAMSALEIGRFAYLMLALYAFIVPDRVWVALAKPLRPFRVLIPRGGGWPVFLVLVAATSALALLCRIEYAAIVGLVLAALAFAIALARRGANLAPVACAHLAAIMLWSYVDRVSAVSADYYNLWGGSSRRLGDLTAAERAYRSLVALDGRDGNAHFKLGRVLLDQDREAEGLAELHAAERLEINARAWLVEARWELRHGRRDTALTAARGAVVAEPSNAEAADLARALLENSAVPVPAPEH